MNRALIPAAASWMLLAVSMFISGCGGGGGGGGSRSDDFTISTNSVTFDATIDGATPASQVVSGSIRNVNQTVYPQARR